MIFRFEVIELLGESFSLHAFADKALLRGLQFLKNDKFIADMVV